ncbi:hypothetical protein Dsin_008243 [Dipteronia sinensis]|uniref:Uncharacterized protein n=1 Tax=Dipteronia sinensis TaxID=43782 RepID=A0AAE0ANB4_9ROSI|nr:hypothetical protein Dsin_008243 [Dipteronia sinensis]
MLGYKTTRTTVALNSLFKTIQLDLNKYPACLLRVQMALTSGFNTSDNEIAAKQIFQETHGKPFRLEAYWAIVKDTAKWYHYVEGLERRPGCKVSKARKYKAMTNNVNLLSEDILGYETRSNELYERDIALRVAAKERKRNFVREMEERKLEFEAKDLVDRENNK